jgi:DNA-binding CsgD family transcriptional regulator
MVEAGLPSSGGYLAELRRRFERSLDPVLLCDDGRRLVDVNVAACLFVRLPREVILTYRIDDLLPHERRPDLDATWADFIRRGGCSRLSAPDEELLLPDGARVAGTLFVAALKRGLHLATIAFPPARELDALRASRHRLTDREREVLSLVARGKTGAKIATQLFLAPTTVQTHVNNALAKLGARNRVHAVAIALQSGEIDIDDPPEERAGAGRLRHEA